MTGAWSWIEASRCGIARRRSDARDRNAPEPFYRHDSRQRATKLPLTGVVAPPPSTPMYANLPATRVGDDSVTVSWPLVDSKI